MASNITYQPEFDKLLARINPATYMNPNMTFLQHLGGFLYIINPGISIFKDAHDVPDYVIDAMPIFLALMFIELGILYFSGYRIIFSDYIASAGVGVLHLATNFMLFGLMLMAYEWLYELRLFDIPGDSVYTWIAALLLVDFVFYWTHRAHHEINIFWMFHQVHHSAEDFNFAVPLRLPILLKVTYMFFYLSLAVVGIPLSSTLVHSSLNLLYDFWLHAKLVPKLGPIEWIFVTPSHHRVHHGANDWCLDKNYGSLFIIWDRIFGTFQDEKKDVEIFYGLTTQPMTHNGVYLQLFYFAEIFDKIRNMSTWGDRLRATFYGPGWSPGKPRLGDPDDVPHITSREPYSPTLPTWQVYYIISHLVLDLFASQMLMTQFEGGMYLSVVLHLIFIFVSVGVVTSMYDGWQLAPVAEAVRCTFFTVYLQFTPMTDVPVLDLLLVMYFTMCSCLWISHSISVDLQRKTKLS
ncbi:hypothetical protein SK128_025302 [Halocaridina rubra]|uniref:Fatty acid hydroxylase domain-containing protein n=1 Tax=Halocaridina rubra TaxID=373956 RepID=A0AAN8ZWQ8_HALRR